MHGLVVALRRKYWPLTLQPAAWEKMVTRTDREPVSSVSRFDVTLRAALVARCQGHLHRARWRDR